ncbi:MAG: hypothetical protein AAFZ80_02470, partial [Cyanobacteria bacterium P01_A01_bin.105]
SIPAVITLLIFETDLIQVDYGSASFFFANVIQLSSSIFLIALSVILSNVIKHFMLSRNCPESHVIVSLCNSLIDISSLENWYSSKHRGNISRRIGRVANCFEYYIPKSFDCSTPYEYYVLKSEFKKISNGFITLKQWLHTPTADTQAQLIRRVVNDIDMILIANLDSLEKIDLSRRDKVSRRDFMKQELLRYVSIFFRAAIPFLLLFILNKAGGFDLSDEASTYLSIGAFALSSIILFIELDPNIGDKINILSQIKSLLSREP